jgi:hypothetical protein
VRGPFCSSNRRVHRRRCRRLVAAGRSGRRHRAGGLLQRPAVSRQGVILGSRRMRTTLRAAIAAYTAIGIPVSKLGFVLGFHPGRGPAGAKGCNPRARGSSSRKLYTLAADPNLLRVLSGRPRPSVPVKPTAPWLGGRTTGFAHASAAPAAVFRLPAAVASPVTTGLGSYTVTPLDAPVPHGRCRTRARAPQSAARSSPSRARRRTRPRSASASRRRSTGRSAFATTSRARRSCPSRRTCGSSPSLPRNRPRGQSRVIVAASPSG